VSETSQTTELEIVIVLQRFGIFIIVILINLIFVMVLFVFFLWSQFLNKVLYAKEGAKSIIDKTFVDLPWQVRLEVDGTEIDIPEVV